MACSYTCQQSTHTFPLFLVLFHIYISYIYLSYTYLILYAPVYYNIISITNIHYE